MASRQQFAPTAAWPENNQQGYGQYDNPYPQEQDIHGNQSAHPMANKIYPSSPPPVQENDPERVPKYDTPTSTDVYVPLSAPYGEYFEPQTLSCCWCLVPFFSILASFLVGAGIGLWYYYAIRGYDNSVQALEEIGLKSHVFRKRVHKFFLPVLIVEAVLAFFLLVLSNVRIFTVASYIKKGVPNWRYSCWLTSASFLYFCLQHIMQLWFVVMIAGHTVWFAAALGGKVVSSRLGDVLTDKLEVLQSASSNVTTFVSLWDADASSGCTSLFVSQLNPYVSIVGNDVTSTSSPSGCSFSCIDLGSIPGFNTTMSCLCDGTRFDTAESFLRKAWKEVGYSTLGTLLSYLGCTVVGLNTVNAFSRERRK